MNIITDSTLRVKIDGLLKALCEGLYEREEAVKLALLSAIAGESIFLLGPPGVGKSLIARRLKYAFKDGISFEYLMSKFSTPDEVFGPVSIKKLKEEDIYERLTERYLPGANIVFLDEIWKAGPAIQNALLTILNERIYRNGNKDIKVNIRGIITASNELPPKNKSLDPIWDRFLIRLEIGNIKQFKQFLNMIVDTNDVYEDNIPDTLKISETELREWDERINQTEVPPEVLNTIQVVKIKLDEYNARPANQDYPISIYDRRWKKIVRLVRTSAFLNGRSKADLMDCFLMIHCLWSAPLQRETIKDIVTEAIRQHGYTLAVNLRILRQEIIDFEKDIEVEIRVPHITTVNQLLPVKEAYYELLKEDGQFEGMYVSIKQFRQLQLGETGVTNFYDTELNLVNRLNAKKGVAEHTIEVFHNSIQYTYSLRTHKVEKQEVIFKKPHPIIKQHWNDHYQKLLNYIEKQEEKITNNFPPELKHLSNNLFVDATLGEIVSANLEEVKSALQQLKLRLEKGRYAYESL